MKKDARDPNDVRRDLVEIGKLLRPILEEFSWAYGLAHSPTVRPEPEASSPMGSKGGKGSIAYSDSTGNVIANEHKDAVRELLADLADDIEEAASRLKRVRRVLRKRFGHRARDFMFLAGDGACDTPEEARRSHEAKARREGRGERWGDG